MPQLTQEPNTASARQPTEVPLLAWMLLVLAACHACAAVVGLLPGGSGPFPAVLDLLVAVVILAVVVVAGPLPTAAPAPPAREPALLAGEPAQLGTPLARLLPASLARLLPADPATTARARIVPVAVVVAAALASAIRAAAGHQPWLGVDAEVAVLAGAALAQRRDVAVTMAAAQGCWGAAALVGGSAGTGSPITPAEWALLLTFAASVTGVSLALRWHRRELTRQLAVANEQVAQYAVRDPLTGANNRRGLQLLATPMIENARRQGDAVHCLFIDVDAFHALNEQYGHQQADEALRAVYEALAASIRGTDVLARWSGDQFVVLGPGTGTSPLEMERRMRAHASGMSASGSSDGQQAQISIGSATLVPWDDGNLDSLLTRAEEDMRLRRSLRRQSRTRTDGGAVAGRWDAIRRAGNNPPPTAPPTVPNDR